MFDILKKTLLFGAGLASMTREKMEKFVEEMVKRGELSEKEGRELVDDLVVRSRKVRKDFEEGVAGAVAKTLKKLNIPRRSEIEEILARIEALEKSKEDKKDECSSAK